MKYVIPLCLVFILSCNKPTGYYPCNGPKVLENYSSNQVPFYFPDSLYNDSLTINFINKGSLLSGFSRLLFSTRESNLSNCYLGSDRIRFLYSPSFHIPIILTCIHNSHENLMVVKVPNKIPLENNLFTEYNFTETDIDSFFNRIPNKIVHDSLVGIHLKYSITIERWETVLKIIDKIKLKEMSSFDQNPVGNDGSWWLYEIHFKDNYKFNERWSPVNEFRELGEYLLKLCGYKFPIY